MQRFDRLSWWERDSFIHNAEYLVIGAGITGSFCALRLRELNPRAEIRIIERGSLPCGASTKNAGFACFGSPSEILDDLSSRTEDSVKETLAMRFEGLERLQTTLGKERIGYRAPGSWELFSERLMPLYSECESRLDHLNHLVQDVTGLTDAFSMGQGDASGWGMRGFPGVIRCNLEGMIDTGRMMRSLHGKLAEHDIPVITGVEVEDIEDTGTEIRVSTPYGELSAKKVLVATNGLSRSLLPDLELEPARAQVLITSPIPDLKFDGTFHMEEGYYYFRTVGNRVLFGGGRNLDFDTERTEEMETSPLIMESLERILHEQILPGHNYEIEARWAGIMGVGPSKKPIIEKLSQNLAVGVRLGGMGVAMGSQVGRSLAECME